MAETEEAFRAKASEVCKFYCLKVWNEALNQAGVKASSALRRAKNVYYPPAIRALSSSSCKADTASKEADEGKESPTKTLPIANIPPPPPKEVEQSEVTEKATYATKEVAHDATLPPAIPKDPSKEKKASHNMEIVLATLPILTKEDLKGKGPASSMAASTQPAKTPKDKVVIKMKP